MLAKRLIQLRTEKNISQSDIAKKANISLRSYQRYERGEREPNCQVLIALSDFFNVSIDYLSGRIDKPFYTENDITSQYSDAALTIAEKYDAVTPEIQRRIERYVSGEYNDWCQSSLKKQ